MRSGVTLNKIQLFMEEIGKTAKSAGRVYFVGGSTALMLGFREQTIDVDLKIDPEPEGIFERLATLKQELDINVELASPDHFLPPLPGWKERSEFIVRCGPVEFYHYDFYAQALAKIERGYEQDLSDVRGLIDSGRVEKKELLRLFLEIRPALIRYPAVDGADLERKVRAI